MTDQRCAICKERVFTEAPNIIRQHNPLTFRMAWMHLWCCIHAFEEIVDIPAKNPEFENRLDEYNMKFE